MSPIPSKNFKTMSLHIHRLNANIPSCVCCCSAQSFSNIRRVKSSPGCSCALLSSAARISYVGTWCLCWVNKRSKREREREREQNEAAPHRRFSSVSLIRSGATCSAVIGLGWSPQHCMEKKIKRVKQLRLRHSSLCYTVSERESWQHLHWGLETEEAETVISVY